MKKGIKGKRYVRVVRSADGSAKTCSSCGTMRPLVDFPRGNGPDGFHYWCKPCHATFNASLNEAVKLKVYSYYCGGDIACKCCGEREVVFLSIDHINGDGAAHRRTVASGSSMYYWLVRNGFPPGFQVLCWNCQHAKAVKSQCPHQKQALETK